MDIFKEILRSRSYDACDVTPLDFSPGLTEELGPAIHFKREDLQPIFSFKIRGAYNAIYHAALTGATGVICASAGNHGQGVAYSARKLGIKATVVMPRSTPSIKSEAVARLGAEIKLVGDSYNDAYEHALGLADSLKLQFIHPFDDPYVIAGQGTIGQEIYKDLPAVNRVFVPVGGGGLLAGICIYLEQVAPNVEIIAVEPEDCASYKASFEACHLVKIGPVGIFADGVAVKEPGRINFELTKDSVKRALTVTTDEICAAMKDIYESTRNLVEPSGAVAMAGARKLAATGDYKGENWVIVNSGANMNFNRLQFVSERTETGANRECLVAIRLKEERGTLLNLCRQVVGGFNISEFDYRIRDPQKAVICLGITLGEPEDRKELFNRLSAGGYEYEDLSNNELAKIHIRHMVGGNVDTFLAGGKMESVFRIEFPERPGALLEFLEVLGREFNISLFHYRGFGADYGRAFIGFIHEKERREELLTNLKNTGYRYWDETDNHAYRLFL